MSPVLVILDDGPIGLAEHGPSASAEYDHLNHGILPILKVFDKSEPSCVYITGIFPFSITKVAFLDYIIPFGR